MFYWMRHLQCEGWINEASQFLLTIGRKATDCKRSQDAVGLISQLNQFKEDGATKQNDRLNNMERIATNLYGDSFLFVRSKKTNSMKAYTCIHCVSKSKSLDV